MRDVQGSRPFLLLGGIGVGKTYIGALLEEHGVTMISADRIGHEVLLPGTPVHAEVAERWPAVVIDGVIHRPSLAALVFSDADALGELEAMTHPAIGAEIERRVAGMEGLVGVEIPVAKDVVGRSWPRVVVTAPLEVRRRRLLERGMTSRDIEARIAAQLTTDAWQALADYVVVNDGGDGLAADVEQLVAWLEEVVPVRR